jgi:hypothetical protein
MEDNKDEAVRKGVTHRESDLGIRLRRLRNAILATGAP